MTDSRYVNARHPSSAAGGLVVFVSVLFGLGALLVAAHDQYSRETSLAA
jgi:hypothetical protein